MLLMYLFTIHFIIIDVLQSNCSRRAIEKINSSIIYFFIYYLEASTLWRDQSTGDDYPAEFIIPNCKVQSNFTFTMAPTGDPSTFTFTLDAFPEYTRFNKTKKVIAAIQIVEDKDKFGAEPTAQPEP